MSILEVKNLSKKYNIIHNNKKHTTFRDMIVNVTRAPISIIKDFKKIKREEFWVLKNINFNIEAGEVIGIIGTNGSGKSTLLKILSRITPPTIGKIKIKGKIASLLEVGTGFHSELTGRENIYLNGAILGMSKIEINRNFDKIVEFSGVEKFLDNPVKHYSSGMYVRLAFSVAAHMKSDILLVDEVLAVGDIEFQKRCLGKMDEITKSEGRTILFVSHNLEAIKSLCKKSILLKNGNIKIFNKTSDVINKYLNLDIDLRLNSLEMVKKRLF